MTATALVSFMFFVLEAAAESILCAAESKNSSLWCSPIPKTSKPTLSACSILSISSDIACASSTTLPPSFV